MSDPHTKLGSVVEIHPSEGDFGASQATTLVRTDRLEVIRLVVTPKKAVPTHEFQGESTIQCLRGRVVIGVPPHAAELNAGQLLHCSSNEPFSVKATEEALLLVTVALPGSKGDPELLG
ncbi:MAG: hypothetical protein ACQESR_08580 [Planctomycetota bacterium]